MKTCSIRFILKPFKGSQGQFTVYIQIIYDRKKAEISTGIRCKESDWDSVREEFRRNSILNERISDLRQACYRAKNQLDEAGNWYDVKDIKALVTGEKSKRHRVKDLMDQYLEKIVQEKQVAPSTISKYRITIDYVNLFLERVHRLNADIQEVNLSFIQDLDEFLKQVDINEVGDRMKVNTLNKHHARFKAILNWAIRKGYLDRNPYSEFKLSFPNPKREYLTSDEIQAIVDLPLSNNPTLDKVRDIFLFSCYTGLRFQDAMDLESKDLIYSDDQLFISKDQLKTGEGIQIPVLNPAQRIIEKYSTSKERLILAKILPQMTNQKVNHYLKMIGEMAGIRKPLTHHIARHTCATTVLLENNVPIETVSKWLGHTSLRMTQIYAKVTTNQLVMVSQRLNELV